jgi:type IV secretory pathway protease TraF
MNAMKFNKTRFRNVAVICSVFFVIPAALVNLGLRFNISPSHVPIGFWRACPADEIGVGDIVTFDIFDVYIYNPGAFDERMAKKITTKFIKRVAALPGAIITKSGDEISVNGETYPLALADGHIRGNVDYPLIVPLGAVWMLSNSLLSYDSRYYGPVPMDSIIEKNKPLLTWEW